MSQVFKFVGPTIAIAALTACGGGGDSGAAPSKFTQAEVKSVATIGAIAVAGTGDVVVLGLAYMGGMIEGLASDSGGSRSIDRTSICTTGTARLDVIKTATRVGLIAGDQVTLTADKCAMSGTGYVVNGVAKLTAQSTLAAPVGGNYAVSFESKMTGFSTTVGGKITQYDGVADVVSNLTDGGNAIALSFTVPVGQTFSATTMAHDAGMPFPPISIEYGAGTTFAGSDVTTPNNASRKLDGSVVMTTAGVPALSLVISTPTTLSGTTTTGTFVATSGVIATKATAKNLATSATVSGVKASVSGDTDGNGSLDLVFDSSWSALMTP